MQTTVRGFTLTALGLIVLGWTGIAHATVSLDAPSSIPAGAELTVSWSGDGDPRNFITVVPVGTPEGKYDAYAYTRKASVSLRAPEDPGAYEIRLLAAASPYGTLASLPLTIEPVTATLSAPATVDAGATFDVAWTGPDNKQDFISVAPSGADDRGWKSYAYTKSGNPVALRAPDEAGSYDIRYQTGGKYSVLATVNITVGATPASVKAPERVQAGASFAVAWTGPDNTQDWVSIAVAGAGPRDYDHYAYTREGSPLELRAPDEAGDYEVRYQTGQTYAVLATQAIVVGEAQATLDAPAEAVGGSRIDVAWTGPDNAGDYVGIAPAGSPARYSGLKYAYTRHGNPGAVVAPLEPGDYEIRYQTGQSGKILARRALTVSPPATRPGELVVVAEGRAAGRAAGDAVELILDASGSMLKQQDGQRRIEIARKVLLDLTGDALPAGTPFALRVFGHKEADSCRTDLEIPLGPLDVAAARARIGAIQAMNLAKTPIAASLAAVTDDLAGADGRRVVVLITDGEETCDGDPAAAIEKLRAAGIDARVEIVGFAIDDDDLKASFRYWADLGGGNYHDAADASQLGPLLQRALRAPFDVVDASGKVVARGIAGDAPLSLPAGNYTVRTRTSSPVEVTVEVISGEKTTATLPR